MTESREREMGILLLLLSGAAGFLLGGLVNGTWQLAVESSQVIAGLVEYPQENPFYLYHSKAWTLLHQVPAILLLFGITEKTVCFILSGFIGLLSFVTVSLFVWVFCGRFLFALACPFVMLFANSTQHFAVYPVWMMGTSNSQGVISAFFVILVITFIASGKNRIGSLVLGIAPAVHLAVGLLCWGIVLGALFWDRGLRNQLKANWKYFGLGVAITLLSLVLHWRFTYDSSALQTTADSSSYLYSFVQNWDSHRIPVPWKRTGVQINLAVLSISVLWLVKAKRLSDRTRRLLGCLALTAGVGLVCAVFSWLPLEILPSKLIILMPARILELNVILFFPLILGLIGVTENKAVGAFLFFTLMPALLITENFSSTLFLFMWICLLAVPTLSSFQLKNKNAWALRMDLYGTSVVLLFIISKVALFPDLFRPEPNEYRNFKLSDISNREFFLKTSLNDGILLTAADLHLVQLRTRRPVLLDGGQLDIVPYTLEAAPAIAAILKEVYGVDYWNPPVESERMATIRGNTNREFWETQNVSHWMEIRRRYGVTNVMTFVNWKLNLPVVEQSKDFLLYQIPSKPAIASDSSVSQISTTQAE